MRFGMLARADHRGLSYQSYSVYKAMKPDVTVVIDMSPIYPKGEWPHDFTPYPDAIITPWRGYTAPISDEALDALMSCDVVYSAETFYDPRLDEAAERGELRTVRHVNPELFGGEYATEYWYPTAWRLNHLPKGRVVPMPVEPEHIPATPPGMGRMLHVGGHRAAGDRNGSKIALDIAQRTRKWDWRFTSQDGIGAVPRSLIARSEFVKDVDDRWGLYEGCAGLVMPRRYGGLCLPIVEAMTRGLAVFATDTEPNRMWPIVPLYAHPGPWLKSKMIRTMVVDAGRASRIVDNCDGDTLAGLQAASLEWARSQSWDVQAAVWRDRLEQIALD
jgi:hypothetical protein